MNTTVFVIDTGILMRHLRRDTRYEAALRLIGQRGDPAISVVTRLAIVRGMRSREEQRTLDLLDGLVAYPMDQNIADQAGRLLSVYQARGIPLGVGDAIIAATALQANAQLVTTNPRHFPMPELDVWVVDEEGALQRVLPEQRGLRG